MELRATESTGCDPFDKEGTQSWEHWSPRYSPKDESGEYKR